MKPRMARKPSRVSGGNGEETTRESAPSWKWCGKVGTPCQQASGKLSESGTLSPTFPCPTSRPMCAKPAALSAWALPVPSGSTPASACYSATKSELLIPVPEGASPEHASRRMVVMRFSRAAAGRAQLCHCLSYSSGPKPTWPRSDPHGGGQASGGQLDSEKAAILSLA